MWCVVFAVPNPALPIRHLRKIDPRTEKSARLIIQGLRQSLAHRHWLIGRPPGDLRPNSPALVTMLVLDLMSSYAWLDCCFASALALVRSIENAGGLHGEDCGIVSGQHWPIDQGES